MYRTHTPRPPTADYLRRQIRTSETFIARMRAEGRDPVAEYEQTHLDRLVAALALTEARERVVA